MAQRHAAPLTDHAPALDADKACDLALLWQGAQLVDTPCALVADLPGQLEPPCSGIDTRCLTDIVECVEPRRARDLRGLEGWRQRIRIEERGLHFVVPAGHQPKKIVSEIGMFRIVEITAGQQTHRAERDRALEEFPTRDTEQSHQRVSGS